MTVRARSSERPLHEEAGDACTASYSQATPGLAAGRALPDAQAEAAQIESISSSTAIISKKCF
jgi:hypothetical protein